MSTVDELVSRTLRDWVYLGDDQPLRITLDGDITSNATSLTYTDGSISPDEEELLGPGVVFEIDYELCRITDADFDTNTLTIVRGVNGSTSDSHDDGADITVSPLVLRSAVAEAIKDEAVALYPTLWKTATYELTTSETYVEVPEDVVAVEGLTVQSGDYWIDSPVLPRLLERFPASDTNKAIQLRSVPLDQTAYLVYRGKFDRPASNATDVYDVGVEPQWERILCVGAAATVVASRPQDILSTEYVTEALERESQPPGSAMEARNGLLTLRNMWLDEARRTLSADQATPVRYNRSARR